MIVPNKDILQNSLENYTLSGKRRFEITGVSYREDLEKLKQVAMQALKKVSALDPNEPPFFYESFANSSINFIFQIWTNSTKQPVFLQARSEAIMLLKKAFDENDHDTLPDMDT